MSQQFGQNTAITLKLLTGNVSNFDLLVTRNTCLIPVNKQQSAASPVFTVSLSVDSNFNFQKQQHHAAPLILVKQHINQF